MANMNDGGRAFPCPAGSSAYDARPQTSHSNTWGMSLREYAAIKLSVPNSGLGWLDEMIVESNKAKFAGLAMQGFCVQDNDGCEAISRAAKAQGVSDSVFLSNMSFEIGRAMLSASKPRGHP